MSVYLDPTIATCSFGCSWEMACASIGEADERRARHEHLRHGQAMPPRQLAGSDWQTQAIDAVRTVAARGADFTIYDALREFGVSDPPNARTALGKFSTLVHDLHIAHPCGFTRSNRADTKKSAVAVWNRDQARCENVRCYSRVAAS